MTEQGASTGIERGGFLLFLALVTLALIAIVWPFAAPLLWATLAAIMFQPLYQWMHARKPTVPNRSAVATLAVITVLVVIPALWISGVVVAQASAVFIAFREGEIDIRGWFEQIFSALPSAVQSQLVDAGFSEFSLVQERLQDLLTESAGLIAQQALVIGGGALSWVLAFGVGLYVMFFLLRDGKAIGARVTRALPLQRDIAEKLVERFLAIVRATIKGTGVVALVQGLLGAITFAIVGMPSVALFGVLMALFSLLPAVGPAIIWGPVAIYLLATGALWQGLFVIGSGVLVIGMADNLLRPILVGRDTGIPDWIILVTTLGGIATIGLSGIVLGPMAAGLFLAGWSIMQEQREAAPARSH